MHADKVVKREAERTTVAQSYCKIGDKEKLIEFHFSMTTDEWVKWVRTTSRKSLSSMNWGYKNPCIAFQFLTGKEPANSQGPLKYV